MEKKKKMTAKEQTEHKENL